MALRALRMTMRELTKASTSPVKVNQGIDPVFWSSLYPPMIGKSTTIASCQPIPIAAALKVELTDLSFCVSGWSPAGLAVLASVGLLVADIFSIQGNFSILLPLITRGDSR